MCQTNFLYTLNLHNVIFFRATLMAHWGSQDSCPIRAAAAGLQQSYSNAGSELHLQYTPQLTAMLDPQPIEWGQGSNTCPHGCQSGSLTAEPWWELKTYLMLYLSYALIKIIIKLGAVRTYSPYSSPLHHYSGCHVLHLPTYYPSCSCHIPSHITII